MDTAALKPKSDSVTKYIVDVEEVMKRTDLHTSFDTRAFTKNVTKDYSNVMSQFRKCCDAVPCCEPAPYTPNNLKTDDIKLVITLIKALQDIGTDKVEQPKDLTWEVIDSLPAESFVIGVDSRILPHHNEDFTINNDWLDYGLSRLLSGDYAWM